MDERYHRYARLMLSHSLELQPGQRVLIQCEPTSLAFAEIIAEEVIRAGGHYVFRLLSPRAAAVRLLEGTDDQVSYFHPSDLALTNVDSCICLIAPNEPQRRVFDPARLILRRRAGQVLRERFDSLRWLVALVPSEYLASRLNVSFAECEELLFKATVDANWHQIRERADAIREMFMGGCEVRIVAPGTDLRFSITGRMIQPCDGACNLPDGEAFLAPHEHTVEGYAYFPDPQVTRSGTVEGMRLTFREGKVVEASADAGLDVLIGALDTDEWARYLGEFGIGVNELIQRQTGEVLFDEKIAGTIHLALGNAYSEVGGTNRSLIHWDLILDLRKGGTVYLDGRPVCVDGVWQATRRPQGASAAD
jgi:aminopeptidase